MGYGLPSPTALAAQQAELREAQRKKKNDLSNYVNQANEVINEINEINNKIEQANNCGSLLNQIPGIMYSVVAQMGAVGDELQKALVLSGVKQGANLSTDSLEIIANIQKSIEGSLVVIREYITKKVNEANEKKQQVEQIRNQYQKRLASYPADLGPYAPAPTFPNVPEIKTCDV